MNKIAKDKCNKCGSTKPEAFWDFEDKTVLCNDCHKKYGVKWQKEIDDKKETNIKFEKKELRNNIKKDTKNKDLVGVDGWLGFFILGMVASAILNAYAGITDILGIIDLQLNSGWAAGLILLDIFLFGGIIGLIIYTIICLIKLKTNAVSAARKYLILMLISGITSAILEITNPEIYAAESSFDSGFRGIIFAIIWLSYFSKSVRVANTYPESKRESTLIENVLFSILLVLLLIVFVLGLIFGSLI